MQLRINYFYNNVNFNITDLQSCISRLLGRLPYSTAVIMSTMHISSEPSSNQTAELNLYENWHLNSNILQTAPQFEKNTLCLSQTQCDFFEFRIRNRFKINTNIIHLVFTQYKYYRIRLLGQFCSLQSLFITLVHVRVLWA